jgi:hypothetical protein
MKKGDVIQLTVIILALVIGFNSFQYFIEGIIQLLYAVAAAEYEVNVFSPAIISLLITSLYIAICWQLLLKSKSIAVFIYDKTNIGTSFKVVSRPNDLLYILLIAVGFYYLVQHLPALVSAVVNAFTTKASSRFTLSDYERPADWMNIFLRLLLPVILLMAARPLSNYFAKNVSDEPVMIGDDIGNIDENEITKP